MNVHRNLAMPGSTPPRGYSDGTLVGKAGSTVFLAGHVSFDSRRNILHPGQLVPQVRQALVNLKATLSAAGALPEHLVKMTIYTLDVSAYREHLHEIGEVWREVLGPTYPAMTLLGVRELFDEGALIEIEGIAVVPE